MSVAVEVVRDHFAALARYDRAALESTASDKVQVRLVGVEDWKWTLSTLYRHVSQAWNYMPEDVQLSDWGDGTVHAIIRLANGGGFVKQIEGWYCISGGRIDSIILTDKPPRTASRGVG